MTTTIQSNGSKWAGDEPDSIDQLFEVLASHVLDRRFECPLGHAFISVCQASERWAIPGTTRFHGNFLTLSHVFSIDTDEPELVARLTAAIEANMARPDYLEQASYEARQAADEEYRRANDARRDAERIRAARITLGMEG
jgi:hypothetical protein